MCECHPWSVLTCRNMPSASGLRGQIQALSGPTIPCEVIPTVPGPVGLPLRANLEFPLIEPKGNMQSAHISP